MQINWCILGANGQENARGMSYIFIVINPSEAKIMAEFNYYHG